VRTIVVALVWLVAASASAQVSLVVDAPPGGHGVPFATYVERVIAESPTFAIAEASVRAADAAIDLARVYPSPRISGGIMSVDVSGQRAPNATEIVLSIPIDYAGQVGHRVDQRVAAHQVSVAEAEGTRRTLRQMAASRYVDALEASLARLRAVEAADADAALRDAIEGRAAVGEATALQVALVRLAAATSVARRTEAEGRERTTRLALSELLGEVDASIAAIGDLATPPRTFDADRLVEEALTHRPEVLAAQLIETTARRSRELASASRWPEVALNIGWLHSFASLYTLFNQPEYDALVIGASVEIPLRLAWDGDLRAADAQIDHAEAGVRAAELAVSLEVRTALAAYETARERLVAREGALAEATRLRRAAALTLASGSGTVVELLAAQSAAREAEAAYLSAAADHTRTLAALLARVGRDIDVF